MKQLFALVVVIALAVPAWAHFIWLVPVGDKTAGVSMVFSDELGPDERVPIKKIAQTKLFGLDRSGKPVRVQMVEGEHAYNVMHDGKDTVVIAGTCRYGVLTKGKAKPFLLMYHPKTALRAGSIQDRPELFEPTSKLPLEIVLMRGRPAGRVMWQGKPAADVSVTLKTPGMEKDSEGKTDADGRFELVQLGPGGVYGIRALFVEKKAGVLDGKKYDEIKHYATFTFHVPPRTDK